MNLKPSIALLLVLITGLVPHAGAAETANRPLVTRLSLEQLMETEVVSVSKTRNPISRTPAAVFVINQEDIRRSTARNVPELLRMVPGLQVAQITQNRWAITARGFNGFLANKLLVLIDGRSVYNPLFNQVYWDIQDLLLENIERIEVIRGPGGSIWGSNAVNGVINIITKHSSVTQGGLIKAGGGSERQTGALRYGGDAGRGFTYRATGKYFNENSSEGGNDAWYLWQGSSRADWQVDDNDSFMATGSYYNGEEDMFSPRAIAAAPFNTPGNIDQTLSGGHALLRWEHIFSETSDASLQTYFDQARREEDTFGENRYNWDIEWNHRFLWGERHEIVYGAGYRLQADDTDGSFGASFDPENKTTSLIQAFLQDTVTLIKDKLWFTAGLKTEHNDYSGWEFLPTARLLWNPHPQHTFWTAFSRAVRIPARLDHDVQLSGWLTPGTTLNRFIGDTTREPEVLLAYEAGYRVQPHQKISLDIAAFYNDYDNYTTIRPEASFMENGYTVLPFFIDDQARAETYGVEIAMNTQITGWWSLKTAYTFLVMQVHQTPVGTRVEGAEGQSPEHQLHFLSHVNLPRNFEFDAALRFVDRLNNTSVLTPAYWELDIRLGWRPAENLLLAVHGTNLLHPQHLEFPDSASHAPQVERAVYAEAVVEF